MLFTDISLGIKKKYGLHVCCSLGDVTTVTQTENIEDTTYLHKGLHYLPVRSTDDIESNICYGKQKVIVLLTDVQVI